MLHYIVPDRSLALATRTTKALDAIGKYERGMEVVDHVSFLVCN